MEIKDEELHITDLFDAQTLQKIQDAFCEMTNIAAGISDANGVAVTRDSISSDFCMNYNKKSVIGKMRCEQCDKRGGELALAQGKSVTYHCHAGLVDFAAPIMAHGKMIGCFIGGQVRTEELDEEKLAEIAGEIGVEPKEYIEAARKIRYIDQEELKRATKFLYQISMILSDMAYDRYTVLQVNEEIEHATRMKSDFLANMSHEIRTPMNAIIGMAEMALREEVPPAAMGYINQIISSGKSLLTIINDILDFSKIESGKMTIEEDEYEPMSLINDVANIINTRIGEKDVELILDIAPDLPYKLYGDSDRLKQIMINLSNNAVKFTKKGEVVLKVGFEKTAEEEVNLTISVMDTGIGIKKQDLPKLFQSFQQVDSKRNRNIEGTGLGLAITKQLVSLMGGDIWVESEYGKGSEFFLWVPQKVVDERTSVHIRNKESIVAAGLFANGYLKKHIAKDMRQLKIDYSSLDSEDELEMLVENKVTHFFIGHGMFSVRVEAFVRSHPEMNAILMIDFRNSLQLEIDNLLIVKKPVYVLNIASIFNGEDINTGFGNYKHEDFEFIAPEANILIVDDNAINLTVAEGLLKPLQMNIETAPGGKEAVDLISVKKYDLILMDHMMPELDGVETTHIIRRFHKEYDDVPIIALTANAVSGTKEMFLQEGMNDFIAKPIEMRTMLTKLRNWLPKEKIKKVCVVASEAMRQEEAKTLAIDGLDTKSALELLGSEKLFWAVLKDYYQVIDKKAALIKQLEQAEDWHAYTIEVHALKSASRQIGAAELADMAMAMEKAGNEENASLIHQCTDEMLIQYRAYQTILKPYFEEKEETQIAKKPVVIEEVRSFFEEMREAMDELDMDRMDEILLALSEYEFVDVQLEYFEQLKEAVADYNVDCCEELLQNWEECLGKAVVSSK